MSFTKTLSRDEMKNVKAGYRQQPGGGGTCHAYCCPVGGGDCSNLATATNLGADSHEGCQSAFVDAGANCPNGQYVAALYS